MTAEQAPALLDVVVALTASPTCAEVLAPTFSGGLAAGPADADSGPAPSHGFRQAHQASAVVCSAFLIPSGPIRYPISRIVLSAAHIQQRVFLPQILEGSE